MAELEIVPEFYRHRVVHIDSEAENVLEGKMRRRRGRHLER